MKPSRALYLVCGGLMVAAAVAQPIALIPAAVALAAAIVFDNCDL